jgi:hypothetical protein
VFIDAVMNSDYVALTRWLAVNTELEAASLGNHLPDCIVAHPRSLMLAVTLSTHNAVLTGRVCEHHSLRVGVGEIQSVSEEERPHKRQLLKIL